MIEVQDKDGDWRPCTKLYVDVHGWLMYRGETGYLGFAMPGHWRETKENQP